MRRSFWWVLAILGISGCSDVTAPPAPEALRGPAPVDAANNIRIVPDKSVFSQAEASGGFGIMATVTNASNVDFYARVGDGFNSALDQPTLYAALGAHAVIERLLPGSTWEGANTAVLIEGTGFVVLKAGKSYRLNGTIAPKSPGVYRIRLDYSDHNHDESAPQPFHDYSALFRVR